MSSNLDITKQLDEVDWSFSSLSNSGIHSFHWYPATFVAAIPGTLIPILTKPGSTVLDPFCGSGTTGVEAIRLGRKFIGIDTNPIALLMSEAKLYFPDPRQLRKRIDAIMDQALFSSSAIDNHPRLDELRGWYHPNTLIALNGLLESILEIDNIHVQRCVLSIFSGIAKNASSQGKHWGWVCDNVKPKPHEIIYKDAHSIFLTAANDYIKFTEHAHRSVRVHVKGETRKETRARYSLVGGDCVQRMTILHPESIDLIMTSPPYYGVADYVKSQRLSYLWFDKNELLNGQLGFRNFETLRATEAGARSNRHRKNSHELYINFMQSFFEQSYRILKEGACIALVVGESQSRSLTTDELVKAAKDSGLEPAYRKQRDIKMTRRRLMAKVQGEDILVFQKK